MKSLDRFNLTNGGEHEIAQSAHQFRRAFGVADKLYVDIIGILEFKVHQFVPGFRLIIRRDVELSVTAETTIDPPRIFVRESIYDAACDGDTDCRLILAHELGHLLLHTDITGAMQEDYLGHEKQFSGQNLLESSEDQADVFARNFLVPAYVAFHNRSNSAELAKKTGTPPNVAMAAITVSKRVEMLRLREFRS